MNKRLSTITAFSTLVLASGCGTSGINGTTSDNDLGKRHTRGLCTISSTALAPATGRIADFSSVGGVGGQENTIPAKIVTYGLPKPLDPALHSYTTTGGHLNFKINAPATSSPQLLGTLLQFDSCIDASAFTGVEFTVSGAFSALLTSSWKEISQVRRMARRCEQERVWVR